jgi:hypothetical protein
MTRFAPVLLLCLALLAGGCAATQVAIEKKDLKVETLMSETVFLDLEKQVDHSVFVDVRNTSDKDLNLRSMIMSKLQDKGYTLAEKPADAGYILQINVLQIGQADPAALRTSVYGGYGGVLAGGVTGALIGGAAGGGTGALYGAGIGAVVGGAADMVAGSLVKDVTYSMITDVLISEKEKPAKGKPKTPAEKYKTRVASSANKVNLKLEEALPPLQDGLARSIAGIF